MKRSVKLLLPFIAVITSFAFFVACQPASTKTEKPAQDSTAAMNSDSSDVFNHLLVDNKKDPACGMPVTAGISDTAHYKKHVIGFCSKECKDAFEKSPEALLASADIKK